MAEIVRETYSRIMSDNLIFLMKIYGYNRKQVSSGIDVPYTTYTDWVKGKTYPKIEGIQKLAEFFHVEVSDLSRNISLDKELIVRLTAYTEGLLNNGEEKKPMFEHKSLMQRIEEYDGQIEVYEYDWSDLLEGDFFDD